MENVVIKRIYEDFQKTDGCRILVDRLWPRGIKKENAHIDLWLKEIAPTNELRKWFGHEDKKWNSFFQKYLNEIEDNTKATQKLLDFFNKNEKITLLYGAKDKNHNQAVVLKQWLECN